MPTIPPPNFDEMPIEDMLKFPLIVERQKVLELLGFYREHGRPTEAPCDPVKKEATHVLNEIEGILFQALLIAHEPRRTVVEPPPHGVIAQARGRQPTARRCRH